MLLNETTADLGLDTAKLQGLKMATVDQLANVVIEGPGTGLAWPDLDVAHSVSGLNEGVFGTYRYMEQLARAGGLKTSPAKAAAARANGKKGGRKRRLNPG